MRIFSYPWWYKEKLFLTYPKDSEMGGAVFSGKNIMPLLREDLKEKKSPQKEVLRKLVSDLRFIRKANLDI